MKKRERIYRWTAALTAALTAASILTVPAFAETSVGADSAVALPMAKHEDGLDFATVWEMSLNTAKNAELQKEQLHELLEKRFGVEDETELTFSEPYYWYYNFNEFAVDEDLYTYFVFQDGELLGIAEGSPESWNHRWRISNLCIFQEKHRRCGVATALMEKMLEEAAPMRMAVLETQTCNERAIAFYRKCGFQVIGFDLYAYSNHDPEAHEVRLEMGKKLT